MLDSYNKTRWNFQNCVYNKPVSVVAYVHWTNSHNAMVYLHKRLRHGNICWTPTLDRIKPWKKNCQHYCQGFCSMVQTCQIEVILNSAAILMPSFFQRNITELVRTKNCDDHLVENIPWNICVWNVFDEKLTTIISVLTLQNGVPTYKENRAISRHFRTNDFQTLFRSIRPIQCSIMFGRVYIAWTLQVPGTSRYPFPTYGLWANPSRQYLKRLLSHLVTHYIAASNHCCLATSIVR